MHLTDMSKSTYPVDSKYLDIVFPDFFNMLHHTISVYTVTVNEYAYLCLFLYPHYMERVYKEHGKIRPQMSEEEVRKIEAEVEALVMNRGQKLGNKQFRCLL